MKQRSALLFAAVILSAVVASSADADDCISVWLDTTYVSPGQDVLIPVYVQNVTGWGIVAFDMEICWCETPPGLLQLIGCDRGPVMPPGWYIECNPCSASCITVAAAGATPLAGEGVLFYLEFHVSANAKPCMCCDLEFEVIHLYDPERPLNVCSTDGIVCVEWCSVMGKVMYWPCDYDECDELYRTTPLPDVRVHLDYCSIPYATTYTNTWGYYYFTCLPPPGQCLYCVSIDYCAVPRKAITPLDATMILRYLVCLDGLDDCPIDNCGGMIYPQRVAADASCSGAITPYDAALILQYVVGRIPDFPCPDPWVWFSDPCNGCTGCGVLSPGYVDWIGVLIGDVNGNYSPPAPAPTEPVIVRLGDEIDLGDRFEVPIVVEGAYDVFSSQIDLTYDSADLYVISVSPAGLAAGSMSAFMSEAGDLRLAMAQAETYHGSGEIVVITLGKLNPIDEIGDRLVIDSVMLNDGDPPASSEGSSAGVIGTVSDFALGPAVPNPFRDGTVINYSTATASEVCISIFNVTGQLVTTLIDQHVGPGTYAVTWNGTDYKGTDVARGVYFCRMNAGTFSATSKVVLIQ